MKENIFVPIVHEEYSVTLFALKILALCFHLKLSY